MLHYVSLDSILEITPTKNTRALEMVRLQKHVASMWLTCIHSKLVFHLNSEVPVQKQSPEHSRGKCLIKIEMCRSQLGVFYYNHYWKRINSQYELRPGTVYLEKLLLV